jgi:hypothetical protein
MSFSNVVPKNGIKQRSNRDRLLAHDVAGQFFRAVVAQAKFAKLMSGVPRRHEDVRRVG